MAEGWTKGPVGEFLSSKKGLKVMKADMRKENWETENVHVHVYIYFIYIYDPRPPVKAGAVSLNTHTSCVYFSLSVSSTQILRRMISAEPLHTHVHLPSLHVPEKLFTEASSYFCGWTSDLETTETSFIKNTQEEIDYYYLPFVLLDFGVWHLKWIFFF